MLDMNNKYNTILINGEPFNCLQSMSLYDLLIYLDFDIDRVIVEYNSKVISNYQFNDISIHNHDKLEVITIVGGG